MEQYESGRFATCDGERGVLKQQGESQPFVPIAAHRSLVKMGLAITPREHFRHFGQRPHGDGSTRCCFP